MRTRRTLIHEAVKQRRFLWMATFCRWIDEHDLERISDVDWERFVKPAIRSALFIEAIYRDREYTARIRDAKETDRTKLNGQVTALAWMLRITLKRLTAKSGFLGASLPPLLSMELNRKRCRNVGRAFNKIKNELLNH